MASVTFNKQLIEKQIKLTPEIVESIQQIGIPVESNTLDEITLEVLANRPDLFSSPHIIDIIKNYHGKKISNKLKVKKTNKIIKVDKSAPINWKEAYGCCVTNLKLDEISLKELIQLQEKLASTILRNRKKGAIGVYPLEEIKFPITLKGLPAESIKFHPLESNHEMTGLEIIEKHPTGKTYSNIVKDWKTYPVFYDSSNNILSMPPIINAEKYGRVTTETKSVFIEVTGQNTRALKLALIILATSLEKLGGVIELCTCIQQNGTREVIPEIKEETMKISLENTNKLLGLKLTEKEMQSCLKKMGFNYSQGKVSIPLWRKDILHEVDLIEEVAIGYGYHNLIPEIPNVNSVGEESWETRLTTKIREIVSGLGILETSGYHLIKEEEQSWFNDSGIELENAKTEYKLLRSNLITELVRIISENKDNEYPQNLFQIGKVFSLNKESESGVKESTHLAILATPSNSNQIRQYLDALMHALNINYTLEQTKKHGCIEGRTMNILIEGVKVGIAGEIHPDTLKDAKCKLPASFFEINLDFLISK